MIYVSTTLRCRDDSTPAVVSGPAGRRQVAMGSNAFTIVFAASDGADGSGIDQCATPVLLTLSRIFSIVRCIEHRQRAWTQTVEHAMMSTDKQHCIGNH